MENECLKNVKYIIRAEKKIIGVWTENMDKPDWK